MDDCRENYENWHYRCQPHDPQRSTNRYKSVMVVLIPGKVTKLYHTVENNASYKNVSDIGPGKLNLFHPSEIWFR